MTSNQLAYLNLMESQRKRAAEVAEQRRSNLAKEAETRRSNLAKEAETARSNSMNESLKIGELSVKATPKWAQELGLGTVAVAAPTIKSSLMDVNRGREQQQEGKEFLNNLFAKRRKGIKMDNDDVKAILALRKEGKTDSEIVDELHLREKYNLKEDE